MVFGEQIKLILEVPTRAGILQMPILKQGDKHSPLKGEKMATGVPPNWAWGHSRGICASPWTDTTVKPDNQNGSSNIFPIMVSFKGANWQEIFVRVLVTFRLMPSVLWKRLSNYFLLCINSPLSPTANRFLRIWHRQVYSLHEVLCQPDLFSSHCSSFPLNHPSSLSTRPLMKWWTSGHRVKTKNSAQPFLFNQANI